MEPEAWMSKKQERMSIELYVNVANVHMAVSIELSKTRLLMCS